MEKLSPQSGRCKRMIERMKIFKNRGKDFFKSSKKVIKENYFKVIESPNFKELTKNPKKCIKKALKSVNVKKVILSKFGLVFFGYVNTKIMRYLESENSSVLLSSYNLKSEFLLASTPIKIFYVVCVLVKIGLIVSSCNTLRSTPLVFHYFIVTYSSKTKLHTVSIEYFLKNRLLNPRYKISVELKIIDGLYFFLILSNYKNIKFVFIGKYARYADFSIFLVILMIQLVYNILDFINLDSSKK
jgi:hypothetical protein